ncbi:MAG: hypothetical protein KGL39_01410 [Patescibacteria group bacterium]|nr:hypothetical protein [Patescibacteria group bacterium]
MTGARVRWLYAPAGIVIVWVGPPVAKSILSFTPVAMFIFWNTFGRTTYCSETVRFPEIDVGRSTVKSVELALLFVRWALLIERYRSSVPAAISAILAQK